MFNRLKILSACSGILLLTIMGITLLVYRPMSIDDATIFAPKHKSYSINGEILDFSPMARQMLQCLACIMVGGRGPDAIGLKIDVTFPESLVVDETATISLTYGVAVNGKNVDYFPSGFKPSKIALNSSGLDIKPVDPITIDKTTKLPLTSVWAITAKNAGRQIAIFSLSQDLLEKKKGLLEGKFSLNNVTVSQDDLRSIIVPIVARTVWGITSLNLELIKMFIALVAFVLMLPSLTELLKFWLSNKKVTEPPSKDAPEQSSKNL